MVASYWSQYAVRSNMNPLLLARRIGKL
eukprot:COSAG03_NODE_17266_length_379_cov_1.467857_1_plen_27_part_01